MALRRRGRSIRSTVTRACLIGIVCTAITAYAAALAANPLPASFERYHLVGSTGISEVTVHQSAFITSFEMFLIDSNPDVYASMVEAAKEDGEELTPELPSVAKRHTLLAVQAGAKSSDGWLRVEVGAPFRCIYYTLKWSGTHRFDPSGKWAYDLRYGGLAISFPEKTNPQFDAVMPTRFLMAGMVENTAFFGIIYCLLSMIVFRLISWWRGIHDKCPECNYALIDGVRACPECGWGREKDAENVSTS